MRMTWKARSREIERLKQKHGKDRSHCRTIPDYTIEHNLPPLSNYIGGTGRAKPAVEGRKEFPVGHFHKQGYCVIGKGELEWAGGKKS